jgi:hypothetical protein
MVSTRHWNWWGSAEMCKLVLKKRTPMSKPGAIRDIVIDTLTAEVRGTSTIVGHADQPIEHLPISNVELRMREENALDKRATRALSLESVRDLRIRDLSVRWSDEATEPKWQSALVLRRVTDFVVEGFLGRQGLAANKTSAIVLDQAVQGAVLNARGRPGCQRLIHVQGNATRDIIVKDSRVPSGASVVTFEKDALKNTVRVS